MVDHDDVPQIHTDMRHERIRFGVDGVTVVRRRCGGGDQPQVAPVPLVAAFGGCCSLDGDRLVTALLFCNQIDLSRLPPSCSPAVDQRRAVRRIASLPHRRIAPDRRSGQQTHW